MPPNPPLNRSADSYRPLDPGLQSGSSDRLIALTLALEESLAREAWNEADDLFAARDVLLADLPGHAIPHEVDDIDARILARLQHGQAEIRLETQAMTQGRQAAVAYAGTPYRSNLKAA